MIHHFTCGSGLLLISALLSVDFLSAPTGPESSFGSAPKIAASGGDEFRGG
jgi:hypothetical protein